MGFSSWRESTPFLGGGNPVLGRELRQTLRNERAFALMAIYVSVLGAVVASNFPADQAVAVGTEQPGAGVGYMLFKTFCLAQAAFIVIVLPALAAGTLAQERERGTLESFLLTPLTPREIVWGKAAGVLCFGGLLLTATLPLTSLSFLLGGVSPADVITAYVVLLALAAFVTGFGLYCSARWTNAVRATVACYALLPVALLGLVAFSGPGAIIAGITLIAGGLWAAMSALPRWKRSRIGKRLGIVADTLFYLALTAMFGLFVFLLAGSYGLGFRLFMLVFVTPYMLYVAKLGLEYTGEELARHREPVGPARERLNDLRIEWQRALEVPESFVPAPTGRYTYSPQVASTQSSLSHTGWVDLSPAVAKPPVQSVLASTSGRPLIDIRETPVQGNAAAKRRTNVTHTFLPDGWNPVFMRDMRSGILGRGVWIARVGYGALIAGQLCFLLRLGLSFLLGDSFFSMAWKQTGTDWPTLARLHLMLILLAGAVFGARAFAPEREQQTLPQLLTTPLSHRAIIGGKLMTALTYTSYAFLLGAPLTVLVALLSIVSVADATRFLALEVLLGVFAASWGLFCSMRGLTARRALGWSLGGIGALLFGEMIVSALNSTAGTTAAALRLLPMSLISQDPSSIAGDGVASPIPFAVYGLLTALLLIITIADFKRYASQV